MLEADQQQTSSPVRNIATNFVPSGGGFSTAQPDLEVNLWTRKDAANTPFENGNRLDVLDCWIIICQTVEAQFSRMCLKEETWVDLIEKFGNQEITA